MTIRCYKCDMYLPEESFSPHQLKHHESTGYAVMCKTCNKDRMKKRNKKNVEENRKKAKEYYHKNRDAILKKKKEAPAEYSSEVRKKYYRDNPEKRMYWSAKERAKKKNISFTITVEDINIPDRCPVLDIPLYIKDEGRHAGSPSLDRIDSSRGYEKENIQVVSYRANEIKSDATLDELERIVKYVRKNSNS